MGQVERNSDLVGAGGELSPSAVAYLNELAADIAANGGHSGDWALDIQNSHERRRAFGNEMLAGKTRRSQHVRQVLATAVFVSSNIRSTFDKLELAEADGSRVAWLQAACA